MEGTRMWRRGADSDGYVANFVESEQIVQLNGYTASFVQVYAFLHICNYAMGHYCSLVHFLIRNTKAETV